MNIKVTSRIAHWGRLLFLPSIGCSCSHLSERNSRSKLKSFLVILCLCVLPPAHALQLSSDSELATAGYFQLSWDDRADHYQLQESNSDGFTSYKVIYQGKDLARVVSGKPDGEFYYRLLTTINNKPQLSNVIKVSVKHHSLQTAIIFFIAGAIVFIATLILIINGNRKAS